MRHDQIPPIGTLIYHQHQTLQLYFRDGTLDRGEGRAATASRGRSRKSEPKAARQSPADNPSAPIPTRSSSTPNRNGAADCSVRAGADSKTAAPAVASRPKQRQWQAALNDRDHAVA